MFRADGKDGNVALTVGGHYARGLTATRTGGDLRAFAVTDDVSGSHHFPLATFLDQRACSFARRRADGDRATSKVVEREGRRRTKVVSDGERGKREDSDRRNDDTAREDLKRDAEGNHKKSHSHRLTVKQV